MRFVAAGKRVLITGASSGLGAALARQLAAHGAVVGLIARRRDRLGEVLAECRCASPESTMWVADLADTSALHDLASAAWDALDGIDVLINNAAVPKRRPVMALDPDEVEDVMRVNFFAAMRLTLALLPRMLARGSGLIVNVSSVGGRLGIIPRNSLLCKQVRAVRMERGDGRGPARHWNLGQADRAGPGRHRDLGPAG